ncbi:unnamed protein product [Phaedon cochleariae]|uniref:Prostaglandin reductase 1 n=1 Tax=Phaedon cochleariae TaxID=80249 RepID=A0A9P0GNI1_PHACE|nr:unnamed protein product [Phaedon cochleariae]
MVKAKVYKYVKEFEGTPKKSDFKVIEEELPELKNGEFLAEATYLSVDPYMRAHPDAVGETMVGTQVAKVIKSKNPKFPVGKLVVGGFGWRSHTISNGDEEAFLGKPYVLPDIGDLSPSLALGVLGMPGNTAYFGLLELGKPKSGETVVVSGAAGAVGSIAGQIAKIKGCNVIGIAGSDAKAKWLVDELGFDHSINYKTQNVHEELSKMAPKGVDCYYDNVGGEISDTVLKHMNVFGRIVACGAISQYNNINTIFGYNQTTIVFSQLTIYGFVVNRWLDRWLEGIVQMAEWVKQGKVKYQETLTDGFDNMVDAFVNMLTGGNVGKAVVKV